MFTVDWLCISRPASAAPNVGQLHRSPYHLIPFPCYIIDPCSTDCESRYQFPDPRFHFTPRLIFLALSCFIFGSSSQGVQSYSPPPRAFQCSSYYLCRFYLSPGRTLGACFLFRR